MLDRGKRLGWSSRRRNVRHLKAWRSPAADPKLLDAVWEALNVARDNKALVLARQGTIVNINGLAAELCGRSVHDVNGSSIADLLEDAPTSVAIERWQTGLKAASGASMAVEVTRQPLSAGLAGPSGVCHPRSARAACGGGAARAAQRPPGRAA